MDSTNLPLWIEYTKALGTPVAALVAATVAGGIAFRQWLTARNKLKLDFFDRRVTIYAAAIDVIYWMEMPSLASEECVSTLRKHTTTARWLTSPEVSTYLFELNKRARLANAEDQPLSEIYAYGGHAAANEAIRVRADRRRNEIANLDQLFQPFLNVRH